MQETSQDVHGPSESTDPKDFLTAHMVLCTCLEELMQELHSWEKRGEPQLLPNGQHVNNPDTSEEVLIALSLEQWEPQDVLLLADLLEEVLSDTLTLRQEDLDP